MKLTLYLYKYYHSQQQISAARFGFSKVDTTGDYDTSHMFIPVFQTRTWKGRTGGVSVSGIVAI